MITKPPFRAEHVGSLLRPTELKSAFVQFNKGQVDRTRYEAVLERAITRAVEKQERAGFKSITDGEFGRGSWFGFFFERMRGFRLEPSAFKFKDALGRQFEWPTCYACERIKRQGGITADEFRRVRKLTRATPKVTMPSPTAFHFFRLSEAVDPQVYPDMDVYWQDLIDVYRAELSDLAALGCTYVQLDEVPLAMLCDPLVRDQVQSMGDQPDALISRYISVIEKAIEGAPSTMTFGLHLCRGNFRGRWMAAGGYEPLAERLFDMARMDAFFLEYDSERAGDFSPLRFIPQAKSVVLGLISTKSSQLEDAKSLKRRIEEAARYMPFEQLALSLNAGLHRWQEETP